MSVAQSGAQSFAIENGPMIRRIHITNRSLVLAALMFIAIGFIISLLNKDFTWLSRFGALLVGIGTLFYSQHILVSSQFMIDIEDGQEIKKRHFQAAFENKRASFLYAPMMSLAGTVVWAFGDLLNVPFGW